MYNYSLVGYFVLLFAAFVLILNGLTVIKIRRISLWVPFALERRVVEGPPAVNFGIALIVLGVINFMILVWALLG